MGLMLKISLYALSLLFIVAGICHFIFLDFFVSIIPPIIPMKIFLVYATGLFEWILALLILKQRYRPVIAWIIMLYLLAIFPANIYMYVHRELYPMPLFYHYIRLPLQFILVWWAYTLRNI